MPESRYGDWRDSVPTPPRGGAGMVWPPWMDAGYMLASTGYNKDIVAARQPGQPPQIPGNPRRWAIGFGCHTTASVPVLCAPFNSTYVAGWRILINEEYRWFTLFTHGPLVNLEWYIWCDEDADVTWVELFLT